MEKSDSYVGVDIYENESKVESDGVGGERGRSRSRSQGGAEGLRIMAGKGG